MILEELVNLYDRLAEQDKVPDFGYSVERVDFTLIIDKDGNPVEFADLRRTDGNKTWSRSMRVPRDPEVTRTNGVKPHPLCDKTDYTLGCIGKEKKDKNGNVKKDKHNKKEILIEQKEKHRQAFIDRQKKLLGHTQNSALSAFLNFLDLWNPDRITEIPGYVDDVPNANIVFRLDGNKDYIHELPDAVAIWKQWLKNKREEKFSQCMLSGDSEPMVLAHTGIKGVGTASSEAPLVSFNCQSFFSYGLKKADNAPISRYMAFKYATALNYLLRDEYDNHHKVKVGNVSYVFWAKSKDHEKEEQAENLFSEAQKENRTNDEETGRMHDILAQFAEGRPLKDLDPQLDPDTRIFVLGLAPSGGRISIRFWTSNRLETLMEQYRNHWQDLSLEPQAWRGIVPSIDNLIQATAPIRTKEGKNQWPKDNDVSHLLAGQTMQSILTGRPYPRTLLTHTLLRFRSDGVIGRGQDVVAKTLGPLRVALCKAVIQRDVRLNIHSNSKQEIPMTLDRDSTHPGYLLGRLFAELENAQRTALDVNTTIKDRYFSSASTTPANVFPFLVRNVQPHLAKIRKDGKEKLAIYIESEIERIFAQLGDHFPKHLDIESQGRFAIGYYQQREAQFTKKSDKSEIETETKSAETSDE